MTKDELLLTMHTMYEIAKRNGYTVKSAYLGASYQGLAITAREVGYNVTHAGGARGKKSDDVIVLYDTEKNLVDNRVICNLKGYGFESRLYLCDFPNALDEQLKALRLPAVDDEDI